MKKHHKGWFNEVAFLKDNPRKKKVAWQPKKGSNIKRHLQLEFDFDSIKKGENDLKF